MRYLLAALIITSLAVPACAQSVGSTVSRGLQPREEPQKKPEEKPTRSTLENLPDKKFDPWGSVRETPQPNQPAAKAR
jgi:hypothetical protein